MWTLVMDMKIEICNISAAQILGLPHVLRDDHTAVAGGEDQIGIVDAHAPRLAEERHDEEPEEQQERTALDPQERLRSHR